MLIEKELEAKVISAISTALASVTYSHEVNGLWQSADAGIVKTMQTVPNVGVVSVKVGLASQETFSLPEVSFATAVQLDVRIDLDPTGAALIAFVEPIRNLFQTWLSSNYQQQFTALDVDGLSIDGVSVSAGEPVVDASSKTICIPWSLNLSGSYQPIQSTTNEE